MTRLFGNGSILQGRFPREEMTVIAAGTPRPLPHTWPRHLGLNAEEDVWMMSDDALQDMLDGQKG